MRRKGGRDLASRSLLSPPPFSPSSSAAADPGQTVQQEGKGLLSPFSPLQPLSPHFLRDRQEEGKEGGRPLTACEQVVVFH